VTTSAAVDEKITVCGKHLTLIIQFRHTHEARVSEAHGAIPVFTYQTGQVGPLSTARKLDLDDA
jgi:hypothetical protein